MLGRCRCHLAPHSLEGSWCSFSEFSNKCVIGEFNETRWWLHELSTQLAANLWNVSSRRFVFFFIAYISNTTNRFVDPHHSSAHLRCVSAAVSACMSTSCELVPNSICALYTHHQKYHLPSTLCVCVRARESPESWPTEGNGEATMQSMMCTR